MNKITENGTSTTTNGITNGNSEKINGHKKDFSQVKQTSDLSKIDNPPDNPYKLFDSWFQQAKNTHLVLPQALILSTATADGRVSSRTVLLRRLEEDGFVVMTDNRSRKHEQIQENKNAAMVFLWLYRTDDNRCINRQVRIEGELEILTPNRFIDLYENEPLYCKIRAHLCHQGRAIDWEEAKSRHDDLYKQTKQGVNLPMPDHFIAYKLHPRMIEFYHAYADEIGDRINYSNPDMNSKSSWKKVRVFA